MSWLRLLWRTPLVVLHLLVGVLLTLAMARRDRESGHYRHNPYVVSWWHGRLARVLGVDIELVGHRPQPPALLVSNHVSWLDIIVLGSLTHTGFLSKDEVRAWPVIGWLAAAAGTLFIKRGSGQAKVITDSIAGQLETDGLLTLFPEGTTTDGRDVRPFFSRLFGAAIETRARVIPVSLDYHPDDRFNAAAPFVGDQSLVSNLFGLMRQRRNPVRVTFGAQVAVDGLDRRGVAEQARHAIRSALQSTPAEAGAPTRKSASA